MKQGFNFDNVSKTWNPSSDSPVHALENINLSVRNGEFVVLLGPSGCGKSTLLYIGAGLESPSSGMVTFEGSEVTKPSPERMLIFQEASLFPWLTVKENILFGLKMAKKSISETDQIATDLLKLVGLANAANSRPNELSGGMKQRVALARAISMEPKLLFMDEPFAALDVQTRTRMQEHILKIWASSGASVMFVTHSVGEAIALADRIVVFTSRPGKIKEVIEVKQSRPRNLRSKDLITLAQHCEDLLAEEVEKAFEEQEIS
jgi:NitT/TauT family transport system ATP-binding protein